MNTVEVAWPSGGKEAFHDLPADLIYTIVEGKGVDGRIAFSKEKN
jgi:hypothetical protein